MPRCDERVTRGTFGLTFCHFAQARQVPDPAGLRRSHRYSSLSRATLHDDGGAQRRLHRQERGSMAHGAHGRARGNVLDMTEDLMPIEENGFAIVDMPPQPTSPSSTSGGRRGETASTRSIARNRFARPSWRYPVRSRMGCPSRLGCHRWPKPIRHAPHPPVGERALALDVHLAPDLRNSLNARRRGMHPAPNRIRFATAAAGNS